MTEESNSSGTSVLGVKALINYGTSINNKLALVSLEAADFQLENITQGASVTISSVDLTNSSQGIYLLSWTTGVTAGDVLRVTVTKAGYQINTLDVTITP